MKSVTSEQQKSYQNAKICYINHVKDKNNVKLRNIVIIQGNKEVLCIAYVI